MGVQTVRGQTAHKHKNELARTKNYTLFWFYIFVFFQVRQNMPMMVKDDETSALPQSSSRSISMNSSADGSPLKEENFVHSLKSQVDGENVEEIIQSQKKALERFEKTNEMLATCSLLAEKRLERAKKDFAAGKEKICRAKSDLDSIFRRISAFKQTLASNYPTEFVAVQKDSFLQQNSNRFSGQ